MLSSRGFLAATTHPLATLRDHFSIPRTLYAGFDPTAPSLHIGNLLVLLVLAHAQRCGHRVIALVGGATALIGDPSGRSSSRTLMTPATIHSNALGIQRSIAQVLSFSPSSHSSSSSPHPTAVLLNNLDWLSSLSLLAFLRDTAVHFRVSTLLSKQSIASRLSGDGLSFTEFSYQLLQAYDFHHLHTAHHCTVQVGGSDQWGNITSGLDLIARKGGGDAFGLTVPLLTTASGEKFGKSAGNAVWLSAERTAPFDLYQHFLRTLDADVPRFLRLFTMTPLEQLPGEDVDVKERLQRLAAEVVRLVHGEEGVREAEERTRALFGGEGGGGEGAVEGVRRRREEVVGRGLVEVLVSVGAVGSRNDGRRLIREGGCYVHGERVMDERRVLSADDVKDGAVLIRVGKKHHHVITVTDDP